jgi:hypothetical protein
MDKGSEARCKSGFSGALFTQYRFSSELRWTGNFGGFDRTLRILGLFRDLRERLRYCKGLMMIDLIDARKDFMAFVHARENLNADKTGAKVKEEIIKGFEGCPPTKMKEEKRKECAEHPPKPKKPQFQ